LTGLNILNLLSALNLSLAHFSWGLRVKKPGFLRKSLCVINTFGCAAIYLFENIVPGIIWNVPDKGWM